MQNRLEFELRLQQYTELWKNSKPKEAMEHARKYLAPQWEHHGKKIQEAAGLLAIPTNTKAERYKVGLSKLKIWTEGRAC